MKRYKGLLLDIGGVLHEGGKPTPHAREALERLQKVYRIRYLTNTTRTTPEQVTRKLENMGFNIDKYHIFSALSATKEFVERRGGGLYPLLTDEATDYVKELIVRHPAFVVVGDAYRNFTYERLNKAFRYLIEGSELIAAAKNRYFKDSDGRLSMDAGGFVEALEFASGRQATIIGKPSKRFFLLATTSMQLAPEEVLMVGDDIQSDIKGAQEAGIDACLVKTGKFDPKDLQEEIKPDMVVENLHDLAKRLLAKDLI